MKMTNILLKGICCLTLLICLVSCSKHDQHEKKEKPLKYVPYEKITNLEGFEPTGKNWTMAGDVWADPAKWRDVSYSEGNAIILNLNDQEKGKNKHLFTKFKHQDIDLEIDVLMPRGSNSGIYFQSRYEVQLYDSWGKEKVEHKDIGGIYQRWDKSKPKGQNGFEGSAPDVNAAKAPGLWQHLSISFQAPRFDKNGKKISNALFKKVVLNGVVVQENVETSGPTRGAKHGDETAEWAPIMIQGDHGPVAFRNIQYKAYLDEKIEVSSVKYQHKKMKYPKQKTVNLDSIEFDVSGTIDGFYDQKIAKANKYVTKYTGQLEVPISADYVFSTKVSGGLKLTIGDRVFVDNYKPWGAPWTKVNSFHIEAGKYDVEVLSVGNKIGRVFEIQYEAPQIRKQPLATVVKERELGGDPEMLLEVDNRPRLQRCFIRFKNNPNDKRSEAIAVGDPSAINYAIDLQNGALLSFWKGGFADVTDMWSGRGFEQLLFPIPTVVDGYDGLIVNQVYDKSGDWRDAPERGFKNIAYTLSKDGNPTFEYTYMNSLIKDSWVPTKDKKGLKRTIEAIGEDIELYARVAFGKSIKEVKKGLFSVDGQYYVSLPETIDDVLYRNTSVGKEVILPLRKPVTYSLIW
ncbi:family 16 glycoside hydrolase [Reichenbachiella versicolor]|uniref:family 16 glycoside hydrolase n=1 Tax=Reichenbachiella versicolor TaxID=1821036 RepID=UPI000D6E0C34|nr:family 16 glycoside hydrolase [Reichenbachiella versicolor]